MQGDLISRSAVLDKMGKFPLCFAYGDGVKDCWDVVTNAPSVDAVPVVRCRECKHRGGYHCPMYHTETCLDDLDGFDDYSVDKTDGDGFCERGERADNGV